MKRLFLFIMCVFCFCVVTNPAISQSHSGTGTVNCSQSSADMCPTGDECTLGPYYYGTCGLKDGKCDCIPPAGAPGASCTSDEDCDSPLKCKNGICVAELPE